MKPLVGLGAPMGQKTPQLVLFKVRLWRTLNKTNFYDENCCFQETNDL
jgi:hypothetical protein